MVKRGNVLRCGEHASLPVERRSGTAQGAMLCRPAVHPRRQCWNGRRVVH